MQYYELSAVGLEHLSRKEGPAPQPGPGEVLVSVRALSLNYRDLLVCKGMYNPKMKLPQVPLSDAAGVIEAVGEGVEGLEPGDEVVSHFISGWIDGPFRAEYLGTTLGSPAAGVAAEQVVLPADAVLPIPEGWSFAEAATLPIAALTAWSALVSLETLGAMREEDDPTDAADEMSLVTMHAQPGGWVLTLGTGGVSIFALQLARAMGSRVIVTSSSDEKLQRARALGADETINYRTTPDWEQRVLQITGEGVDVTVETAGAGTLERSLRATRAGGRIALLGALTGLKGEISTALVLMKRLTIAGIMVDSRESFEEMLGFLIEQDVRPVIDREFSFDELPDALRWMEAGKHFGKIVVTL